MMNSEVAHVLGISQSRAEIFLKLYRILEGELEKRYAGRRTGASVVMEYLRDEDSQPYRYALNVCREIRNLLSHNADEMGEPVVEPSETMLLALQEILDHVASPRYAVDYGTPCEKVFFAHPNDMAIDVMHRMAKMGYSHIPVMEKGRITGVFSAGSLFQFLEKQGLDALQEHARIEQLKDELNFEKHGAERYLFVPEETTIIQARALFEERKERNRRVSVIFVTKNGNSDEPLLAMLTPWDVLKDVNAEN